MEPESNVRFIQCVNSRICFSKLIKLQVCKVLCNKASYLGHHLKDTSRPLENDFRPMCRKFLRLTPKVEVLIFRFKPRADLMVRGHFNFVMGGD